MPAKSRQRTPRYIRAQVLDTHTGDHLELISVRRDCVHPDRPHHRFTAYYARRRDGSAVLVANHDIGRKRRYTVLSLPSDDLERYDEQRRLQALRYLANGWELTTHHVIRDKTVISLPEEVVQKLQRERHVELAHKEGRRKRYRITEAGLAELTRLASRSAD